MASLHFPAYLTTYNAAVVPKHVAHIVHKNANFREKAIESINASLLKKLTYHLIEKPSGGNVKNSPELKEASTIIIKGNNKKM